MSCFLKIKYNIAPAVHLFSSQNRFLGAGSDLPGGAAAPGDSAPVGRGGGEGRAHHHDPDRERVRELRIWRPPQGQGALEVRRKPTRQSILGTVGLLKYKHEKELERV